MHPIVRDLYKRALLVGRDYPCKCAINTLGQQYRVALYLLSAHKSLSFSCEVGLEYVRRTWKKALRNPENCPSCYATGVGRADPDPEATSLVVTLEAPSCESELHKAVGRGRFMVREMIGVIQLKKYRTMKRRYSNNEKDPSLAREHANLLGNQNMDDKPNIT